MGTDFSVEIERVTKRFGEVTAVGGVSLAIRRGEFFSLLGPSGCGKTTLLRMIGGFELPSEGRIVIDGADMTDVPPFRRPVNMVFQHYALFPHLSVDENVGFGLRYQRLSRPEQGKRIEEALELVRLPGFGNRYPNQLSGGQRQRIALARALALKPTVLLLDEPLGALDQKLRKEMQVELKGLQRSLGITFVFVTHDQEEALTMSDRIAVMNRGLVEQMDDAAGIFERPQTEFVANFMGASNFFDARVKAVDSGNLVLDLGGVGIQIRGQGASDRPGEDVRFVVRPEKLTLQVPGVVPAHAAAVPVTIEERVYQGVSTMWIVRDGAGKKYVVYEQNTEPFQEGSKFEPGSRVCLCFQPDHAVLIRS